jgi:hypothetical protein
MFAWPDWPAKELVFVMMQRMCVNVQPHVTVEQGAVLIKGPTAVNGIHGFKA